VGNAWKFTAKVAHARIDIDRGPPDARGLSFVVRDNGAGFDMAHASRLFQPFHRMHAAGEFAGHGIGLAIVHQIVTRHHGSIRVEAAPQQGACFHLVLPAHVN